MDRIKDVLVHNLNYILETLTVWAIFAWAHVVGAIEVSVPAFTIREYALSSIPYIQIVSLLLASCASIYTIYKIRIDLKAKSKK